ncbi:MAG: glycosyltransferase family 4 protein [bacterium]
MFLHWFFVCRALFDLIYAGLYFAVSAVGGKTKPRKADGGSHPVRAMRILSLINHGGVAKVAAQTLMAMPPEECRTEVLVFTKKFVPPRLKEHAGLTMTRRKMDLSPQFSHWGVFRDVVKLCRMLHRSAPQVVHLHEPQFAPTLRIALGLLGGGTPLIVHLHNIYTSRREHATWVQRIIERHTLRRVQIVACSQAILKGAQAWLGKTRYPIELIEDGSDDQPLWPPDEELQSDLRQAAAGRKIVAMMARIVAHKRIDDFLMAMRGLLDEGLPLFVLLICYGKSKDRRRLRLVFNELIRPEEGEFLFKVENATQLIPQFYLGISTSGLEGLGLALLEYQVEGVPVICSDLAPHREVVTDGETGLLYPVGDLKALKERVRRMLTDAELRTRLAAAGKEKALRRRWSKTAAKTVALYRKALAR